MITTIITLLYAAPNGNHPAGYVIGALISLFILGYLIYSLIKPEKF
jgi:K+-transporting ATPase KdpF subunit